MNINKLIRRLEGLNLEGCKEVSIETIDDNGEVYYEKDFDIFVDDNYEIGLSVKNK